MSVILGINHMFLYPEAITNADVHTKTLAELVCNDLADALDVWVWRGDARSKEEISILRGSGKTINYNIGDRFGEEISRPSSKNTAEVNRAYDLIMREINYGLEAGSKKLIFGSGPDDKDDHSGAVERYFEFVMRVMEQIPNDVAMSLEPTDWDIDKHFLFGPLDETVSFIKRVNKCGYKNLGLLLDMCHIPIMYETLSSAVEKSSDVLNHIHLGNAIVKNPASEFYGDRHIPWGYPDSEYDENDGVGFIKMLKNVGYFDKDNATVSFEMRPYPGKSAIESLAAFVDVYNRAIK